MRANRVKAEDKKARASDARAEVRRVEATEIEKRATEARVYAQADAERDAWTHGCDNCAADAPVEYIAPLGYLCEACRALPRCRLCGTPLRTVSGSNGPGLWCPTCFPHQPGGYP